LKITFDSKEVGDGKGKVMSCSFYNLPIAEGFKKRIGVRRMPIEDLVAHFSIGEYDSNKVIYEKVPDILKYDGVSNAQRIDLPASMFPAYFGVASVYYDTKTVTVFDENKDLGVGKYLVKVQARFQENEREFEGTLIVEREYPYAYWE